MSETITIERRFCGPPDSGNGGYVAGRVAALIGEAAEITLRLPPPLDRPLAVERPAAGRVRVMDGAAIVAEGRARAPTIEVPAPPDFETASEAASRSRHFEQNIYPGCFVCGPAREAGDGLRIFPGSLGEGTAIAAPWVPDAELADAAGRVRPEFLWAALDCPGGIALVQEEAAPILLGRFLARVEGGLAAGEPAVVLAWPIEKQGRKWFAGSAVFAASGARVAVAEATWIVPRS